MSDITRHQEPPVAPTGRRTRARLQSIRRTVHVGSLRMSVLDWVGPEQPVNPPTVVLHGALQTAEGMANLASHLARRGRVIVPDLRGRGETAQPADGYDPSTMAADVAGLIAAMGIDRPVAVGRLHGGLVAWHLAAEHPEAISGLIIGDTPPEVTDGRAARLLEATRSLPRLFPTLQDAWRYYQDVLGLPLERALHDIPFDLRKVPGGYGWRHNLDLIARIEEAALPRSDWDVLARIDAPTLILRGQRGMISEEMAGRMAATIGDCAVRTVLASGRDVFLGGGAEQAFAAIDLFLLRLTDTGLPHSVPEAPDSHARSFIEPLVRALNGRDAAAIRAMLADTVAVEVVREARPLQTGGAELVATLLDELHQRRPSAAFAVERFLASRREASVLLLARSVPVDDSVADQPDDLLSIGLWLDVDHGAITGVRVQLSRVKP